MRRSYHLSILLVSLLLAACGGGGGGGGSSVTATTPTGDNVATLTVNGGINDPSGNVNQLWTSVTLCSVDQTQCQTINNILVDTGSVGLRLFASTITVPLTAQTADDGVSQLAECIGFVDGSAMWGTIKRGAIKIAGEVAGNVPIHVVADTALTAAAPCGSGTQVSTPTAFGGNGILGIGHFQQDCGTGCATMVNNAMYYACATGSTCTASTAFVTSQAHNPIAKFSQDNNGSIIELPAIGTAGLVSATGSLVFGINTRTNNQLGSAQPQYVDGSGQISTTYDGSTYASSFIDSGSNGLFFPNLGPNTIQECSSPYTGFYCPSTLLTRSATIVGASPSVSVTPSFYVANASTLNTSYHAFNDLGGRYDSGFDWGLPFFYGRNVYTAINGMPGISAPYVAF